MTILIIKMEFKKSWLFMLIPITMFFLIFFIVLFFNSKDISVLPFEIERTLSDVRTEPFPDYECRCRRASDNGCFRELTFYSDKHNIVYCGGSHPYNDNITIYQHNSKIPGPFYNRTQLEELFIFLHNCLDGGEPCVAFREKAEHVYEEPNSIMCRYSVSVSNLLTICFAYDDFLSGGFINSTILTRTDIMNIYHVTKDWIILPAINRVDDSSKRRLEV